MSQGRIIVIGDVMTDVIVIPEGPIEIGPEERDELGVLGHAPVIPGPRLGESEEPEQTTRQPESHRTTSR